MRVWILVCVLLLPLSAWGQDCDSSADSGAEAVTDLADAFAAAEDFDDDEIVEMALRHPDPLDGRSPAELAALVEELMEGSTDKEEEEAIVAIVAHTEPELRAELLRQIDLGDDRHTVVHLVFDDVDDAGRRNELLELIDEAAAATPTHELGVISDIDDTAVPLFYDAGNEDARRSFYEKLEWGTDGEGLPGDIHYVTARPPAFSLGVRDRLRDAGMPPGTLSPGPTVPTPDGMEKDKVEDIEKILRVHPGQSFVFLGDDRDRDPKVYRTILQRHPDRVRAVLIRRAGGKNYDAGDYPGIFFFETWAQADAYSSPPVAAANPTESSPQK